MVPSPHPRTPSSSLCRTAVLLVPPSQGSTRPPAGRKNDHNTSTASVHVDTRVPSFTPALPWCSLVLHTSSSSPLPAFTTCSFPPPLPSKNCDRVSSPHTPGAQCYDTDRRTPPMAACAPLCPCSPTSPNGYQSCFSKILSHHPRTTITATLLLPLAPSPLLLMANNLALARLSAITPRHLSNDETQVDLPVPILKVW